MNKSAIKNFAVTARIKLMEAIEQKAYELGITEKGIKEPEVYKDGFRVNDKFFKKYQMKQREKLIQKIKDQGFNQVIEEVAYTWFNRFIAIRFMEVNGYLPTGVRVLSSIESEKIEPDAVTEVLTIAADLELDLDLVYRLQDENNSDDLFKYILVKQCNKLGEIMPVMFEQIEDYTELLLPDKLLPDGSVVRDLISMIAEEDWKEQVEIIGWLYQYYISEKKDKVFTDLKKNIKITKENIPAATQLFTPKWIVQFMVENSLGRLWLELHPNKDLQSDLKYYVEEPEQEHQVKSQLEKYKNTELSPEEIKVLDPCMGSGHILVYAFDILYKIYQNAGYSERDIPQLILEKNLYGLDIDDRAAQLAYFALMMKARSYNRRIFRKKIELNVCSIKESNGIPEEAIYYFVNSSSLEIEKAIQESEVVGLINAYHDAKEYGSILNVENFNIEAIGERLKQLKNADVDDLFSEQYRDVLIEIIPMLVKQAKIMSQKYDVVVTNPPYMGNKGINEKLNNYLKKYYPKSKSDLFAVFIEKVIDFTKQYGFNATINQHSWMFLDSYKKLRKQIVFNNTIYSMLHLGPRAFEDISGEVVQSTAYVLRKQENLKDFKGNFFRLTELRSSFEKEKAFLRREHQFITKHSVFIKSEDNTIIYWATENIRNLFNDFKKLGENTLVKHGMSTGNNDQMLRKWYEVALNSISFTCKSVEEFDQSNAKFVPFNKGGTYRKWYGNNEYVVAYNKSSRKLMETFPGHRHDNKAFYFREGITWSRISTGSFSARYSPNGFIFADAGCTLFTEYDHLDLKKYLALLNSKVVNYILSFLSPTMTFEVGQLKKIPDLMKGVKEPHLIELINSCISLAKKDWDASELSWDFTRHPLLLVKEPGDTFSDAYFRWVGITKERFLLLKEMEEQINHIIINKYNLEEEINPEVVEKDVSIRIANKERDIKSFISYVIGCIFGRYSLDEEGIISAGGQLDHTRYKSFKVDFDNIIPITIDEYFEDDIVSRFIGFVRLTFGQEKLEDNLDFIADCLTKKVNETSRQRIRRYFIKEFYIDHLQTYEKRPIYWMFDSGKNDGFKALMYIHRYDIGTVAKVRTDYLHTLQRKYEGEISRLDLILEADVSISEKTKVKKQKEKLQKQILECLLYDQVIAHVANQRINIELDEGVKVNYEKFQNIEVPQGEGKKAFKANLLTKI